MKHMRAFVAAWPDRQIVQGPLAQITRYHNLALLEELDAPEARLLYAMQLVAHGWSRDILTLQVGAVALR